jgi:hypothetical protein
MNTLTIHNRSYIKFVTIALALVMSCTLFASVANAGETGGGLGDASAISGIDESTGEGPDALKTIIEDTVIAALKFVALLATVVLIIAGVYLVAGAGSDSSREKAKNIVIYTIVGILLIVLAGAIVAFIIDASTGGSGSTGS